MKRINIIASNPMKKRDLKINYSTNIFSFIILCLVLAAPYLSVLCFDEFTDATYFNHSIHLSAHQAPEQNSKDCCPDSSFHQTSLNWEQHCDSFNSFQNEDITFVSSFQLKTPYFFLLGKIPSILPSILDSYARSHPPTISYQLTSPLVSKKTALII